MARKLFFFVIEFGPRGAIDKHAFGCATEAEEGAEIAARLSGGAVAYRQWGDPVHDLWEDPDLLLEIGTLPGGWREDAAVAA